MPKWTSSIGSGNMDFMYLRGSNWSMRKRRRRHSNPWRIIALLVLIGAAVYVDRIVVPVTPPLFIPTPTATRDPESFVNEAVAYFNDGKLSQSISSYESAVLANPNNPANYVSLARVQILAGRYDEALENAELALLQNPENPLAHAMRAWALDFQQNYLEAEAAIKRALEYDENSAIAHAIYSEILVDQGNYERAAEESRLAVDLDPTSFEVRRARGYVLYWTSNYELARNEYEAALAINDNIANVHLMLGYINAALGEYDLAVEAFNRANTLNPTDPVPDYEASRVNFAIGEFARAVQYAEQAVNDDPTNPNMHGNLGVMYAKNQDREQAVDHLQLAVQGGVTANGAVVEGIPLSYDIRTVELYSTYGLTLARLDRCAEAVPIFQAMLSVVPGDEIAVYNAEVGLEMCQQNLEETLDDETAPGGE